MKDFDSRMDLCADVILKATFMVAVSHWKETTEADKCSRPTEEALFKNSDLNSRKHRYTETGISRQL